MVVLVVVLVVDVVVVVGVQGPLSTTVIPPEVDIVPDIAQKVIVVI